MTKYDELVKAWQNSGKTVAKGKGTTVQMGIDIDDLKLYHVDKDGNLSGEVKFSRDGEKFIAVKNDTLGLDPELAYNFSCKVEAAPDFMEWLEPLIEQREREAFGELEQKVKCCVKEGFSCQLCPLFKEPDCREILYKQLMGIINMYKEIYFARKAINHENGFGNDKQAC